MIKRDKRTCPRCLHWHGWLPAFGCNGDWAVGVGGSVSRFLETKLGGYSPYHLNGWIGSEEFVSGTTSCQPATNPDVWTDGSLVRDDVAGFCCGGAGVFSATSGLVWRGALGGTWKILPPGDDLQNERCRLSFSLPHAVQSVQRAELWG